GVVHDLKLADLVAGNGAVGSYFFPLAQDSSRLLTFAVRSATDPAAQAGALRDAIAALDRELPVYDIQTMEERTDKSLVTRRSRSSAAAIISRDDARGTGGGDRSRARAPAPHPVPVPPLHRRLSRSHQRRLRRAADERRARLLGDDLRLRRGHLLSQLHALRDPEQRDPRTRRRAAVDRADHG